MDEAALRFYEVAALLDHAAHQVAQSAILDGAFPLRGECAQSPFGGVQDFFHAEGVGEESHPEEAVIMSSYA